MQLAASPALRRSGRPTNTGDSRSRIKVDRICRVCGKNFSKTEHLLRHERSHTKDKPFRCPLCNKVYSRHDTLLRHSKSHDVDASLAQAQSMLPSTIETNNMDSVLSMEHQQVMQTFPAALEHQNSVAQDWHNRFEGLPSPSQPEATGQVSRPALSSNDFPTADRSQATHSYYPESTTHGRMLPNSYDTFSISLPNDNSVSPSTFNSLEASFVSANPSWLIGYDFDLEALNTSVSTAWDTTQPLFQSQMALQQLPANFEHQPALNAESQQRQRSATDQIRKGWFTQISDERSSDVTRVTTRAGSPAQVAAREQYEIGDSFRHRISDRLRAPIFDDPLPSTRYLNLSVQVYFTKFNQTFPVIHGQTFRPNSKNSLLLLSIASIGSLLLGSKSAAAQGTRIFERLNKAILANWEQSLNDPREAKSMIQAALIGQTFGLLSGVPEHLAIVEAFHGTIIAWARRYKFFTYRHTYQDIVSLSGVELQEAWDTWAGSEEIVRTVHGLYIHDAMLSRMFHHEPLLRHRAITVPAAAGSELFNARNASTWKRLMLRQSFPQTALHEFLNTQIYSHDPSQAISDDLSCGNSMYTAYTILNGISASVSEKQQTGQLAPESADFRKYFDALMQWSHIFARPKTSSDIHGMSSPNVHDGMIMVLWHTVFMELVTDFDSLERAIGRDGPDSPTAKNDLAYANRWPNSGEGQRCIVHADALIHLLGAMRLDAEPAIHIPHCLFMAGIATYSYTIFRGSQKGVNELSELPTVIMSGQSSAPDFPEFTRRGAPIPEHLLKPTQQSSEGSNSARNGTMPDRGHGHADASEDQLRPNSSIGIGMMCTIIDLLRRIGHWRIARNYAATLSTLAQIDGDDDWMLITNDY